MVALSEEFGKRIFRTLEEEEEDLYVLTLHYLNHEDLRFFDPKDRVRVKKIFEILMKDTKEHSELLKLVLDLIEK